MSTFPDVGFHTSQVARRLVLKAFDKIGFPIETVLATMVGGLADLGYFLFLDLGGCVNFFPGTVMTLVSSAAIILSLLAYFQRNRLWVFEGE